MLPKLVALWKDEAGLTTVEYALLLVLIVSVGVLAWQTLGTTVSANVDAFNSQMP